MMIKVAILFIITSLTFGQQRNETIRVVGDSLIGRTENGNTIREVIGNVVMTQGNVNITCDRAIQNITMNSAELISNVVVTRDTVEILTERGYYYGNEKYTYSDTSISLEDGHIVLTADTGYYYFDIDKAIFNSNVQLVDSVSILNSDKLTYLNKINKAISVGNVEISNKESSIFADSLIHFRDIKHSEAYFNVMIDDIENNLVITGDYLIDDGVQKYTRITGMPLLRKIDTTSTGDLDTLYIRSVVLESIEDSTKKLIATDSVKIIRGDFYSVNNISVLYQDEDKILTYKNETDNIPPILWYQNSQVIGDSIDIYLNKNQLDWIEIKNNATIISQSTDYEFRFDQIAGDEIKLYFTGKGLTKTDVLNNVLSIYYLYEEGKPNGLLKSSSQRAQMIFEDNAVVDVRLFQSVESEYHPENLITDKLKDFTLPTFIIYNNKPDLKELLKESN
ncbi:MAG: OstA-like protein [Bacteroidota bacterium]